MKFNLYLRAVSRLLGRADANLKASSLLREIDRDLSVKLFRRAVVQLCAAGRIHVKAISVMREP